MSEIDFYLDHDLKANDVGDYTLVEDKKNIDLAVKRRLLTPLGALFYDETYGNPVFNILSNPMNDEFIIEGQQGITDCLNQESRITVISVDITLVPQKRKAIFKTTYTYNIDGESTTIEGSVENGSITI